MSNYDFHALLEPLEFEKLVCDIISQRDGISLRMYKEGRDEGVDGSYTDDNIKIIVQAKRYQSNFKSLYRSLTLELPKVRKLQPDRYILGISMALSKSQVDDIIDLFKEFNVNEHDILDRVEMNRLLEQPAYKQTVLKFPKLWFPNVNVLEKILNESLHSGIHNESTMELKDACQKAKTFVPTKIYHKALRDWSLNHVIVLSGEPGVGKTTMAQILALAYLQPDNLNGFIWVNSIEDVYKMLENDHKQVFILDDYWGSIFPEEHNSRKNEDRLDKLIKHIAGFNGNKRLIITTREYILQQVLQKHPLIKGTLEQYALICTMEDYGDDEKANILYSHLYTSNLEYEYVYYLYMKTDSIVYHQNYNPRVLSLFLEKQPDKHEFPSEYYEQLCNYLDCPNDFWKSIFISLSPETKFVAMLLLISSTPAHRESIKHCYHKYIHQYSAQTSVKNLGECIAELEETMIKSVYSEEYEDILLKFSMPAVQDFLFAHLQENCEQWVPKLLECCSYYNQLQFLLEYLSVYCSDKVSDSIVQQCIKHYHEYGNSVIEYDGSWNWDINLIEESGGRLDRFFHLLHCYQAQRHPRLYNFLETEIKSYCLDMGNGDLREQQYTDLHNLPDIIVRCVKIGMNFNGQFIINKYYENAFSVHHFEAMQQFQDVFSEEYALFQKGYYPKIKSKLKRTILSELEFLNEYCMDIELDMLIDDIPDLLKKFNLRYTKEFEKKIYTLCGRNPYSITNNEEPYKPLLDEIDWNEQSLDIVKDDARNWLLGPKETYLEDDKIVDLISKCNLHIEVREKLKQTLDTATPLYVYNLLQTKESIDLLFATLDGAESQLLEKESNLSIKMLFHIAERDSTLLQNLVLFCAESFSMFMYNDDPVLRKNLFLKSDVYATYLENDALLREIVFQHLMIEDEQWVHFLHIPLFIFCYASVICFNSDGEELKAFYPDIWGDNFNKLKQVLQHTSKKQPSVFYADFGFYHFKNYEWEGCMYRMFEELNPYHFNQTYVAPAIQRFLDKIGYEDDTTKVLNHVSISRLQFEYEESGIHDSSINELSDELCIIEHLGISEIWCDVFPPQLTKRKLIELKKGEIAQQHGDKWAVFIYKITDVELLKEFGVYDTAIKFLRRVEKIHTRFINGDYSQIKDFS
ncbi:ATP-binding protein [Bacillus haynesii]|uniref:ATP-binding protein n=1 Tax=Bacillus haynesii TaxID=1925021 RepID=UPI002DB74D2A|nr:ATP-binding protein [Bacillus haynesii]MEC1450119.1 ATP-binding protein [Bacillus haynesii]